MAMRVPTIVMMDVQFTATAGANCLGPYAAADADTEDVQTRAMFLVPPPYTKFVMQRQSFTPHQLWSDLVSLIITNRCAADCGLFLNWAHVACTYRPPGQGNVDPEPPATSIITLIPPIANQTLHACVWDWVSANLPTLQQCAGSVTTAYEASLNLLATEFRERREAEDRQATVAAALK